jgi:hypothetical protein
MSSEGVVWWWLNLEQTLDTEETPMRTTVRLGTAATALALAATATVLTAPAANAKADSSCLRAGLATLQDAGLVDDVARDGLSLAFAVDVLEVAPREGTDVGALPATLPLSVVLRDHLAGDDSLFVYPWCG